MSALTALAGTARSDDAPKTVTRTEHFDRDPGWDGHNNRLPPDKPVLIKQDFGYSKTAAGGRVGGFITPAAEPAYYAKVIPMRTMNDALSASGTLTIAPGGGHTLIGFFNAGTLNEWRTPSTLVLRVQGRGAGFHAHVEYATQRWRAGGDFFGQVDPAKGKKQAREIPSGAGVHTWSLAYDPHANQDSGAITATLDGEKLVVNLAAGHKADQATFNRFGLVDVMKSSANGNTLWLGDITINGTAESFDRDPAWEQFQNRRTYSTENVRPRFNFGFSPTHHAGGKAVGELGGLTFRGDERYPERMAYYGDRLETLTLEQPLQASGKVCLRRGVTDSTSLIGFFHATDSMVQSQAQKSGFPENFLGVSIEGPSREGFLFYPAYGVNQEAIGGYGKDAQRPHIYPDGKPHDWTLTYTPTGAKGGRITVTLDGQATRLELSPQHRAVGAHFNRFGIITTHIDGNGQHVYFDDLTYTCAAQGAGSAARDKR